MQRMNDVPAAPAAHRYVQASTVLRAASPTRATCQPKTRLARPLYTLYLRLITKHLNTFSPTECANYFASSGYVYN